MSATAARCNAAFAELLAAKTDALAQISARHARMRAILEELGAAAVHVRGSEVVRGAFAAAVPAGAPSAAVAWALGVSREGGVALPDRGKV